ncbi:MAG: hypothetical protein ACI9GW_001017 [Halieaceae bacterium]|jgi:uncharacterized protein YhhL (DUF1145 family)
MKLDAPKIITIILWLAIIANLVVVFPQGVATTLNILGLALLAAHLGEYILFKKKIDAKPESGPVAFFMTMVFGLFYWKD